MRVVSINISTAELQTALREWCERNAVQQPEIVFVESHGSEILQVDLHPQGFVETHKLCRHKVQS